MCCFIKLSSIYHLAFQYITGNDIAYFVHLYKEKFKITLKFLNDNTFHHKDQRISVLW